MYVHATRVVRGTLAFGILLTAGAYGACPPDCVPGGGPAASDCLIQFSGVAGPSKVTATCTDGTSCDLDGQADGTCLFGLQACLDTPGPSCTASVLSGTPTVTPAGDPVAQELAAALAALDPSTPGCTPQGLHVRLTPSLTGIKPVRVRLTVTAVAGARTDRDRIKLICNPGAPRFANDVQPIFTRRCATAGCHAGPTPSEGQSLEAGKAYASDVDVHSAEIPKLLRVKKGSITGSFLARKILGGKAIPPLGQAQMPSGCPNAPPAGGCLTSGEIYTILAWIKTGAPDN